MGQQIGRRAFIVALGGAIIAGGSSSTRAQQLAPPVVGILSLAAMEGRPQLNFAFNEGLEEVIR